MVLLSTFSTVTLVLETKPNVEAMLLDREI